MLKSDYNYWKKNKVPSINGLARNAALNVLKSDLENKIPNLSSLVKKSKQNKTKKKADYNTKFVEIKKNLPIIIMTNILLLQNLINFQQKFLM